MEEKELDLDLDFRDLIYDYENRVPCISGAALMEQDFVPAEFVVKGWLPKGFCILGGSMPPVSTSGPTAWCPGCRRSRPGASRIASAPTPKCPAMAQEEKTCLLGQLHRLRARANLSQ